MMLAPPAAAAPGATPSIDLVKAAFTPAPGFLNAATLGLPPVPVVEALQGAVLEWQSGRASAVAYDGLVQQARDLYATFVGVPRDWVAVGSQTSVFAGMVAASLPEGAEVVCVEGDFSSMVYPFLVAAGEGRGITVRQVPLGELAAAISERTTLVAFSLAQSACGSLCDAAAVVAAARAHGALTFCDLTQAAGWMPVTATDFDITVCSAYKWMCQPRGTAYLTVAPQVRDLLRPVNAGWYAGDEIWASCYGPSMHLAQDARRFDVSPAWLSWAGAVPALEVLGRVPTSVIRDHDVALANALRAELGLEACARPVVSLCDPSGAMAHRLEQAGAVVASRAGRVRIAFHVWNTPADVALVAEALAGLPVTT